MSAYKVKITIVKVFEPKDIIGKDYILLNGKKLTKCGAREGLEFIVGDRGDMPEGFCHHAWFGLYKNINILRYGGSFPDFTGNEIYTACPDGLRTVCFKLERVEEG